LIAVRASEALSQRERKRKMRPESPDFKFRPFGEPVSLAKRMLLEQIDAAKISVVESRVGQQGL